MTYVISICLFELESIVQVGTRDKITSQLLIIYVSQILSPFITVAEKVFMIRSRLIKLSYLVYSRMDKYIGLPPKATLPLIWKWKELKHCQVIHNQGMLVCI